MREKIQECSKAYVSIFTNYVKTHNTKVKIAWLKFTNNVLRPLKPNLQIWNLKRGEKISAGCINSERILLKLSINHSIHIMCDVSDQLSTHWNRIRRYKVKVKGKKVCVQCYQHTTTKWDYTEHGTSYLWTLNMRNKEQGLYQWFRQCINCKRTTIPKGEREKTRTQVVPSNVWLDLDRYDDSNWIFIHVWIQTSICAATNQMFRFNASAYKSCSTGNRVC
jgi:hypothetical protein